MLMGLNGTPSSQECVGDIQRMRFKKETQWSHVPMQHEIIADHLPTQIDCLIIPKLTFTHLRPYGNIDLIRKNNRQQDLQILGIP